MKMAGYVLKNREPQKLCTKSVIFLTRRALEILGDDRIEDPHCSDICKYMASDRSVKKEDGSPLASVSPCR